MFLVDSHCHLDRLDLSNHGNSLENAIIFTKEQGIGHMLCVCITLKDFPDVLRIAESDAAISASLGLHPNEIDIEKEPTVEDLVKLAQPTKVVAIGETGLDYFRSQGDTNWQRERFRRHIRAAKEIKKPLIIHTRQARADTLAIMREEGAQDIGGVMHCFTEDWDTASAALDMGFYISFSGIVTFPNAKDIQDVATRVPLERMLIETDSPYLAPIPFRGKSNEPAYVRYVAEAIAKLRAIELAEFADRTTTNFFTLFKGAQKNV